jgi:hypothetical protein
MAKAEGETRSGTISGTRARRHASGNGRSKPWNALALRTPSNALRHRRAGVASLFRMAEDGPPFRRQGRAEAGVVCLRGIGFRRNAVVCGNTQYHSDRISMITQGAWTEPHTQTAPGTTSLVPPCTVATRPRARVRRAKNPMIYAIALCCAGPGRPSACAPGTECVRLSFVVHADALPWETPEPSQATALPCLPTVAGA